MQTSMLARPALGTVLVERALSVKPLRASRLALPSRPVPRRRRCTPTFSAALEAAADPATTTFIARQIVNFCAALVGMAAVFCTAYGSGMFRNGLALAGDAAVVTNRTATTSEPKTTPAPAASPATAIATAAAPAAPLAMAMAAAAVAPSPPASPRVGDVRTALQSAVAEAVAAVKTAAEAPPQPVAFAVAAKAAPAASALPTKPRMTIQEASQQVKEWISAFSGVATEEPAEAVQLSSNAATVRVTEPSLPSSAAKADTATLTADSPANSTAATGTTAASATATAVAARAAVAPEELVFPERKQEQVAEDSKEPAAVGAVAAAAAGVAAVAGAAASAAASAADQAKEAAKEYERRISQVLADSRLAYQKSRNDRGQARAAADQNKAAATIADKYQAKINDLWSAYQQRSDAQAATTAAAATVDLDLSTVEAAKQGEQAAAGAAAAALQQQPSNPLQALLAWIARIVQAFQAFVQQLVGGRRSNSGARAASTA